MFVESKEIIKKLKDFVEELENEELKESISVPSFAEISKVELKEVIELYRTGKIDLKKYWKVGDTKEVCGCKYVILDFDYDKDRSITIMRTDLIDLNVSLSRADSSYECKKFEDTLLGKQMREFPEFFIGRFFSGLNVSVPKSELFLDAGVFLPSDSEVFYEDNCYKYFKNKENRKLGNAYWTRSGSNGNANFVYCTYGGSQSYNIPTCSRGLVPCFVI